MCTERCQSPSLWTSDRFLVCPVLVGGEDRMWLRVVGGWYRSNISDKSCAVPPPAELSSSLLLSLLEYNLVMMEEEEGWHVIFKEGIFAVLLFH